MLYYDFQKHPFFNEINPFSLIKKFGSPLYVYNENILRAVVSAVCHNDDSCGKISFVPGILLNI